MSQFSDYVMPEIQHCLDSQSDVDAVERALRETGVDWKVNESRGEA